MHNVLSPFIPLLHRLADTAGDVIRPLFRKTGFIDKPDDTPVTLADRGAEEAIRTILKKERPQDGVWGEEYGAENMDAEWTWIIDPIDGTKAFIRGMPMFATLIGLMHKGVPVLGCIDQPILRERWLGGQGVPTTFNSAVVRTRACQNLNHAVLNATAPSMFYGDEWNAHGQYFEPLAKSCKYALWGGDAYAYGLVASGFIDIQVDALLKLHDWAALVPVIEGAGGRVTGWKGEAPTLQNADAVDGRIVAVGDPSLLTAALNYLKKA